MGSVGGWAPSLRKSCGIDAVTHSITVGSCGICGGLGWDRSGTKAFPYLTIVGSCGICGRTGTILWKNCVIDAVPHSITVGSYGICGEGRIVLDPRGIGFPLGGIAVGSKHFRSVPLYDRMGSVEGWAPSLRECCGFEAITHSIAVGSCGIC